MTKTIERHPLDGYTLDQIKLGMAEVLGPEAIDGGNAPSMKAIKHYFNLYTLPTQIEIINRISQIKN